MANLTGEFKRAMLQSIYDAVVKGFANEVLTTGTSLDAEPAITLEDGLIFFQQRGFNANKDGKNVIGTAGVGHEAKWAAPAQWRDLSPDEVFSLAQEFREVYDEAIMTLQAQGFTTMTDLQIKVVMMDNDRLQSVTSTQRDFTLLRWNQRY